MPNDLPDPTPPDPPILPDNLDAVITEAASGPKSVTVDGQTVQTHDLKQLIDADRYLAAKKAARGPGIRFSKLVPPGAD